MAKGDNAFLLARPIFRGKLLVLGRVIIDNYRHLFAMFLAISGGSLSLTEISSSCRVGSKMEREKKKHYPKTNPLQPSMKVRFSSVLLKLLNSTGRNEN